MDIIQAIERCSDERLKSRCAKALAVLTRTLDLYRPAGVAFSFNGGKDSTVLLHLLRAAVVTWQGQQQQQQNEEQNGQSDRRLEGGLGSMHTFFFHHEKDFPQITEFTHQVSEQYGLEMEVLQGDFKAGLSSLLARTRVKAIVLGTRKGDPNAGDQETFCPSSPGWPCFMRVNPILEWCYHDVWAFLRATQVSYCCLYDQGYTSLGFVDNTEPNSALIKEDGTYAPAHLLPDAALERAGRAGCTQRGGESLNPNARTAALVIIGDEILSAKVDDANTRFLCAELRAIGWKVCKVVMLRDEVAAIAAEIRALSAQHDVVVTSGGLGPTLDDVTMQAVAGAFQRSLIRHPELEARLRAYFGGDITEAHLKMAEAPSGPGVEIVECREEDGCVSPFPLLRCRNVYVLPGIPSLLRKKWQVLRGQLIAEKGLQEPFRTVLLRLGIADETQVASSLEEVAAAVGVEVAVGSYPVSDQVDGAELVLSLESKNSSRLEEARTMLLHRLPQDLLVAERRDSDVLNSPMGSPLAAVGSGAAGAALAFGAQGGAEPSVAAKI